MPAVALASFNIHAGTDGWGRPYDLVGACRELDAEVLVLQEVFAPLGARSQAEFVAAELGCRTVELPLARAWRRSAPIWQGKGWEPRRSLPRHAKSLRFLSGLADPAPHELAGYEEGTWGLAVLSRHEIVGSESIELGKLQRDYTRRAALLVELTIGPSGGHQGGGDPFTVIGMHGAHLTAGSPRQFRRLKESLARHSGPAALLGDMNLWGPPLSLLMPGWTRAVRGRTWPAWRPHSQTDHILVRAGVDVAEARVIYAGNSDHRAVRAALEW